MAWRCTVAMQNKSLIRPLMVLLIALVTMALPANVFADNKIAPPLALKINTVAITASQAQ